MARTWTAEQKEEAKAKYHNKMNHLHKVEDFNGETVPEHEEKSYGFKMSHEEKLQSMLNAIKVLPPNMIINGRHSVENVQALNVFKVTESMMDEVYKNYNHPEY